MLRKTLTTSAIGLSCLAILSGKWQPLPIVGACLGGLAVTTRSRQYQDGQAQKHLENKMVAIDYGAKQKHWGQVVAIEQIDAIKLEVMRRVHPINWAGAFKESGIKDHCDAEIAAAQQWLMERSGYAVEVLEEEQGAIGHRPIRLPKISADVSDPPPEGATLIDCKALNDVNKYPVVMLIAPPGSGKSATMGAIMEQLSGWKAIASPKPLNAKMQGMFDLVYGCDPETGRWLNWGNLEETNCADYRDLSFQLHKAKKDGKAIGSMLDFLWGCRRESMNRMQGTTENKNHWRCFFDEASYTYTSGYNNPQDARGQAEKATQTFISGINKDAFQNFRGQKIQYFLGAQVETVESIGLSGFNGAKKEAWFLFPGMKAIAAAEKHGKPQLAQWLKRRVKSGFGVALLIKEGVFFEVLDLPSIAELSALVEGVDMVLNTPVDLEQLEAEEETKKNEAIATDSDAGSNGWKLASRDVDGSGFSDFYRLYIKSQEWEAKRKQRLEMDGHKCAVCKARSGLEVHHNDYSRLGDELMSDLITLCKTHHKAVHAANR
jgi:hypothetical protein